MTRPRTALALLLLATSCSPTPSEPAPWFREVALERGLIWTHVRAHERRTWFPEIMGGGVGLLDVDGDGATDVYLVQSGDLAQPDPDETAHLFRNQGGRFVDVTATHGDRAPGYGMGVACGDADEDGDTDLYVTCVGPNRLVLNEEGVLRARPSGVEDPAWGTSATWIDHDADGDLDLFVANYLRWAPELETECLSPLGGRDYCSPLSYGAPARDVLLRNEGAGRFFDVSEEAGLGAAFGNGLGVVADDFDGDGRLDLYVANDMMPNQLWLNRGDGTFVDRALLAGCAVNSDGAPEAGMGTAAEDVDQDGDADLFVTHLRDETNTFYENQRGHFRDRTAPLGLSVPSLPFTGFGLAFRDFDLDGRLDLYVANGAVTRNRVPWAGDDPFVEPDQVFQGLQEPDGRQRFAEVLPRGACQPTFFESGRGLAAGDLDGDGDPDLVIVSSGGAVRLLENVAPRAGHWISLRVREASGRDALGARVELQAGPGRFHRTVNAGGSYASSHDPRVACGLGDREDPVTAVVTFVDGTRQTFGPLEVDREHELRRGAGR
jgi:hypothetical protein